MLNSTVVDVAVGLFLVYGMLSSVCSVLNEYIQRMVDARARQLERAVQILLADKQGSLFASVKNHALIRAVAHSPTSMPSYLPSSTFTQALFDALVTRVDGDHPLTFKRLRDGIQQLPDGSDVKAALLSLAGSAENDVAAMRKRVEKWFDDAMDRLSGRYKRHVTIWILALGFVVAAVTNADTILLVQRLEHEGALRTAVAARATDMQPAAQQPAARPPVAQQPAAQPPAAQGAPAAGPTSIRDASAAPDLQADMAQLQQLNVLFWDTARMTTASDEMRYPLAMRRPEWSASWLGWLALKLAGLALTALAVSLGAPFWFDLLGRLVNLRATGARPAKTTSSGEPAGS
ncbi:MAG TPA: hypothetical protein VHW23_43230 [Kofleriaceae bacterium]|jgi:hypothetical protein|nr:hypothetical protein [Kofleriaceae bacterium]